MKTYFTGLTALKSDEVYEFMLKDFPEKYQVNLKKITNQNIQNN